MEENASNDLKYYIRISKDRKDDLASIRLWKNLQIAFDQEFIWVKGLDFGQVHLMEIKSLPYKSIFYENQGKLFPQNSQLPQGNIPALLWTPIERALPIQLPGFNHNYFGLTENLTMNLIQTESEVSASAMVAGIEALDHYITSAPDVRLHQIQWVVLNKDQVFLLGTPLLPISGESYWKRGDFILPGGFDFELYALSDSLNKILNNESRYLIIYRPDNTYALIPKDMLQPLSLSSFRATKRVLNLSDHK